MARAAAVREGSARTGAMRSAVQAPTRRRSVAPARKPARRVSGAVREGPGSARTGAIPSARRRPARRGVAVPPAGARVLDALLTGRAWIALVGVLLAGIVFFNVDLLQMNRDITQMADRAAQLKRENARIRLDVARLASSERIQEAAAQQGLVLPAPDEVRYLKSTPRIDARNASKRIIPPDGSYVPPAPVAAEPVAPVTDPTASTGATPTDPTGTTTTPPTTTTTPPTTSTTTATGVTPASGAVE